MAEPRSNMASSRQFRGLPDVSSYIALNDLQTLGLFLFWQSCGPMSGWLFTNPNCPFQLQNFQLVGSERSSPIPHLAWISAQRSSIVFSISSSERMLLKTITPNSLQKLAAYSWLKLFRSNDFVQPSSSRGIFLEQRNQCCAYISYCCQYYNSLIIRRTDQSTICCAGLLGKYNHWLSSQREALASSIIFCILGLSKSSCMNQSLQFFSSLAKGTSLRTCPPRVVWKQTIFSFEHLKIIPLNPSSCILLQSIAICWILFRFFSSGILYCAPQLAYTYLPFSKESRSTALMSSLPSLSSSLNSSISDYSECYWLSLLYSSNSMCRVAPTIFWLCTQTWFSLILGSFLSTLTLASDSMCSLTYLVRNLMRTSLSRCAEAQIWFISRKVLANRVATSSVYSGLRSCRPFSRLWLICIAQQIIYKDCGEDITGERAILVIAAPELQNCPPIPGKAWQNIPIVWIVRVD